MLGLEEWGAGVSDWPSGRDSFIVSARRAVRAGRVPLVRADPGTRKGPRAGGLSCDPSLPPLGASRAFSLQVGWLRCLSGYVGQVGGGRRLVNHPGVTTAVYGPSSRALLVA